MGRCSISCYSVHIWQITVHVGRLFSFYNRNGFHWISPDLVCCRNAGFMFILNLIVAPPFLASVSWPDYCLYCCSRKFFYINFSVGLERWMIFIVFFLYRPLVVVTSCLGGKLLLRTHTVQTHELPLTNVLTFGLSNRLLYRRTRWYYRHPADWF